MSIYAENTRRIGFRWFAPLIVYLALHTTEPIANDDTFYLRVSGGYTEQKFEVAAHTAIDTSDFNYTIAIGWDISNRFTLEHQWFSLGSYRFRSDSPTNDAFSESTANTHGGSVAALIYLAGSNGLNGISKRRGFNLYAKLAATGIFGDFYFGHLDVFEDEIGGWRAGLGLGVEYAPQATNFAFRTIVETLEDDLVFGSISVVWRWGRQ